MWRCRKTEYGGSPSTCFIALCGGKHGCCSRRGRTSRFFVPLRQTVPGGSRDKATTSYIMQTSASIQQRKAQRTLAINTAAITAWLNAKSKSYTTLCGYTISRREVLLANVALAALGMAAIVANTSLALALVFLAMAGYSVYHLNKKKGGNK